MNTAQWQLVTGYLSGFFMLVVIAIDGVVCFRGLATASSHELLDYLGRVL